MVNLISLKQGKSLSEIACELENKRLPVHRAKEVLSIVDKVVDNVWTHMGKDANEATRMIVEGTDCPFVRLSALDHDHTIQRAVICQLQGALQF